MDVRLLSICIGALALVAGGAIYGIKFCRNGNYLVGVEWFLLALSSGNFMLYELTGSQINYVGVVFLDTFSRAFGLPIITVAGLMVLTHRYHPSMKADILFFTLSSVATLLVLTEGFAPYLPYFLLFMWSLFTVFLVYFAYRLYALGERGHAGAMVLVALTNQLIAMIYDFYVIPGDATNVVFNFYTIALFVWTFLTVQTWYSYRAFERALDNDGRIVPMAGAHK